MKGIQIRDLLLGVIATCLLLITMRVYDTSLTSRAKAQERAKPMQVEVVGSAPVKVEVFRRPSGGGEPVPVFDAAGKPEAAIPVQLMARSGDKLFPLESFRGQLRTTRGR